MRLDIFLSTQYGFSRNRAQSLIESGIVFVNEKKVQKCAFLISSSDIVHIEEDRRIHWVSRSAEKLLGFLEFMTKGGKPIQIHNKICLDIGSSTWGFSQVLLEQWALSIDAVDVGTDQLHPNLRNEPKIHSFEQTDIRLFRGNKWKTYDIIVCDASFISLIELLPSILSFADTETKIILLYKPQFEVGKENLRKTGVPKDVKIIDKYLLQWEQVLYDNNCEILRKEKSSLIGEAGNQEWIYFLEKRKKSIYLNI